MSIYIITTRDTSITTTYEIEANTPKSEKNVALKELRLDADSKYFYNAEFIVANIEVKSWKQ
jgi:hypothetical protein